jgi:hypothetical protein
MTMGLVQAAQQIERQGRNGDDNLVHMSDGEVHTLDKMQGGPSFNPRTGLREYSFLSKLLPFIGSIGLNLLAPGMGSVLAAGLGSAEGKGAQQLVEGKKFNLGDILKSGAFSAAGAELGQGLSGGGWDPMSTGAEASKIIGDNFAAATDAAKVAGTALPKAASGLSSFLTNNASRIGGVLGGSLAETPDPVTPMQLPPTQPYDSGAVFNWLKPKNTPKFVSQPVANPTDIYGNALQEPTMYANGGNVSLGLPPSAAVPQSIHFNTRHGGTVKGAGDGKSDDIPAMLSNGEHVFDAATVSDLGNGDNDTGQKRLEEIKQKIRRSAGRKNPKTASPKQKGLGSLLSA